MSITKEVYYNAEKRKDYIRIINTLSAGTVIDRPVTEEDDLPRTAEFKKAKDAIPPKPRPTKE